MHWLGAVAEMETESISMSVVICGGNGSEKTVVVSVSPMTTVADVVHVVDDRARGYLVEKWRRKHDRRMKADDMPFQLLQQWGASNPDVQFFYRTPNADMAEGNSASLSSPERRRSSRLQNRVSSGESAFVDGALPKQTEVRKLHSQLVKCDASSRRAEGEVDRLVTLCSSHEQQIQDIRQQMANMRSRLAQCKELAARGRQAQKKPVQDQHTSSGTVLSSTSADASKVADFQHERDRLRKELKDFQEERSKQENELQASTTSLRTKRGKMLQVKRSAESLSQELEEIRRTRAVNGSSDGAAGGVDGEEPDRKRQRKSLESDRGDYVEQSRQPCVAADDANADAVQGGAVQTVVDGGGASRPAPIGDEIEMDVIAGDGPSSVDSGATKLAAGVPIRMISQIDSVLVGRRGSLRRSSSEFGFSRSRPGSFSARSSLRSFKLDTSSPSKSSAFLRSSSDSFLPSTDEVPVASESAAGLGGTPSYTSSLVSETGTSSSERMSLAAGVVSRHKSAPSVTSADHDPDRRPQLTEAWSRSETISAIVSPTSPLAPEALSPTILPSPISASLAVPSDGDEDPSIVPMSSESSVPDIVACTPTSSLTLIAEEPMQATDLQGAERPSPTQRAASISSVPDEPRAVKPILVRTSSRKEGTQRSDSDIKKSVRLDPHAVLLDASFFGELQTVQLASEQLSLADLSRGGKDAVTALHASAVNGWLDCVEYLIAAGADPNAIDGDGWTPLHCAASEGSCDVLRVLVEAGCAILASTADSMSPLEVALDSQSSADEPDLYDSVINYLRDAEKRLGIDDDGRVYAAYSYGDGRDVCLVRVASNTSADNDDDGNDEEDDDDEEDSKAKDSGSEDADSDYEEQPKILESDEISFRGGDCLRILERPDETDNDNVTKEEEDEGSAKWWWAEHVSDRKKSRRGFVPSTYLSLYPIVNIPSL